MHQTAARHDRVIGSSQQRDCADVQGRQGVGRAMEHADVGLGVQLDALLRGRRVAQGRTGLLSSAALLHGTDPTG